MLISIKSHPFIKMYKKKINPDVFVKNNKVIAYLNRTQRA